MKTGALAVGAALGVASSADAAVFNVTNNADSGAGSLRQAISDANGAGGADTITFNAALSGNTITLTSGQMLISDSVDIQGLGSANLTVDANNASRVFYVYHPSSVPVDVTISGLTLTNGFSVVDGDPGASSGGAVRAIGENLTLDDVIVSNSVAGGDGGGVSFFSVDTTSDYNPVSATLTIQNSTITGNAANYVVPDVTYQGGCGGGVWAGGIYNVLLDNVTLTNNAARCNGGGLAATYFQDVANVTIQSSVITGNTTGLGEGGSGGGVWIFGYNYEATTNVSITDTTIADNDAVSYGGGLSLEFLVGGVSVTRTTISGNQAQGGAGVMFTYAEGTIENSTIAENVAEGWGGGVYAYSSSVIVKETTISGNTAVEDGPGIYLYYEAQADIVNSIVANNGPGADLVDDGSSSSFNVEYSLIENEDVATINDLGGNIFGVDPQLGALQNNGGLTETMKPANASPVVNAGDPDFTPPPSTDQRGLARVVGGRIDMGAVELNPGTLQFSVISQNVNEDVGNATITVTRSGGTDGAASVQAAVDGTSTATGGGVDYTFAGAAINFADNDATPQVFNVAIVDDLTVEPSETIVLTLGSATGATIGAPATHTVTILDNDVAPPSADVSITKSLVPGSVTQGDNATFTIAVNNAGPDAAANVVVTDTLPPQLTYVSATPSTGSCSAPPTITCNLGTLNPASSATITLVATMTGTGSTTNTATVASETADDDPADNSAEVTFTIVEPQPGTVQFSVISQSVNENGGTAAVSVTRTGGSDGAASVQVTVDGTSTATGSGTDYTFSGTTINFSDDDATPQVFNIPITDDGDVEPSETIVLTLGSAVGATIGPPSTHTVTILDNDVAAPSADLSVTKTLVPGSVTQGDNATFTIAVNNAGPDAAANVVVNDTLPPQLTYVSATPSTGSCSGTAPITCNLGTLNPASSATITIVATMTGTGSTTNVATVASDTADDDPADNSGQVTFTIVAPQPGTMQFSVISQSINENGGTAAVSVTRTGGSDGAASVQVTVDGTSTATGSGTDYTFSGTTITFGDDDATPQVFNIPIIDDGDVEPSETIVLTLGSAAGATIGAPATHTITIVDNDVAIPPSADVSITKSVVPGSVTQGDDVTFNLAVMNSGPDAAVNVVVSDTLPAQLTFVSATPSVGSCSGTVTITCNLGTLNASASETIQIVATMTGTGVTTNTATVDSDTEDGDGTDNEGSVTFTIAAAAAAVPIPALDPQMQLLLAALVAAAALGILSKR